MNNDMRRIEIVAQQGWHIQYNPKPIPIRSHDYDFWHDDEDGTGKLSGTAKSVMDAVEQISELMTRHETTWVDTAEPEWLGGKRIECSCGFKSRNIGNQSSTQFADLRQAERAHLAQTERAA